MPTQMTPVNLVTGALALGFALTDAIQRALGEPLSTWGMRHGFKPNEVTMCLRGYESRVYPAIRDQIANDLGTTRAVVDGWIEARQPAKAA
jgi:hypothetical protein